MALAVMQSDKTLQDAWDYKGRPASRSLGCYVYYVCREQGRFHRDHLIIVTSKITNLIKNIWSEFTRKMVEYLDVAYKVDLFALAWPQKGDADIWKVYWIIGFSTLAILIYCLKLCVERKRAQLTATTQCVTPTNNNQVWFHTATNALDLLVPVSYLRLGFAYVMVLNLKNHPMEKYWRMFATATKIGIGVLTLLLIVIRIIDIRNTAQVLEDQPLAVADPPDVENQSAEVVQKDDVKNQAYANRPDVVLQMDNVG